MFDHQHHSFGDFVFTKFKVPKLKKSSPLNPNPRSITPEAEEENLVMITPTIEASLTPTPPLQSSDSTSSFGSTLSSIAGISTIPMITIQPPTPSPPPSDDPSPPSSSPSPPSDDSSSSSSLTSPPCDRLRMWYSDDYEDELPLPPPLVNRSDPDTRRSIKRVKPIDYPEDELSSPKSSAGSYHQHRLPVARLGYTEDATSSDNFSILSRPIKAKTEKSSSTPPMKPPGMNLPPDVGMRSADPEITNIDSEEINAPSFQKRLSRNRIESPPELQWKHRSPGPRPIFYPNSRNTTALQSTSPTGLRSVDNDKDGMIRMLRRENESLRFHRDQATALMERFRDMSVSFQQYAQYLTLTIDHNRVNDCLLELCRSCPIKTYAFNRQPYDEGSIFGRWLLQLALTVGSPDPKLDQLSDDYVLDEIFARVIQVLLDRYSATDQIRYGAPEEIDRFTPPDVLWLFVHTAHPDLLLHLRVPMTAMKKSCGGSVRSVVLSLLLDRVSDWALEERKANETQWKDWRLIQYGTFKENGNRFVDPSNSNGVEVDRKGKRKAANQDQDGENDMGESGLTRVSKEEVERFIKSCYREYK